MDLVEFLRARLGEDEEVARELDGARWTAAIDVGDQVNTAVVTTADPAKMQRSYSGPPMVSGGADVAACGADYQGGDERAAHIARHDPARALAEVEAKRGILRNHGDQHDCGDPRSYDYPYVACRDLRLLALPYADHEDYQPEWKP